MSASVSADVCGSMGVYMCVRKCEAVAHNIAPLSPCINPIVAAVVACVAEHPGHCDDRPQQTAGHIAITNMAP